MQMESAWILGKENSNTLVCLITFQAEEQVLAGPSKRCHSPNRNNLILEVEATIAGDSVPADHLEPLTLSSEQPHFPDMAFPSARRKSGKAEYGSVTKEIIEPVLWFMVNIE